MINDLILSSFLDRKFKGNKIFRFEKFIEKIELGEKIVKGIFIIMVLGDI